MPFRLDLGVGETLVLGRGWGLGTRDSGLVQGSEETNGE